MNPRTGSAATLVVAALLGVLATCTHKPGRSAPSVGLDDDEAYRIYSAILTSRPHRGRIVVGDSTSGGFRSSSKPCDEISRPICVNDSIASAWSDFVEKQLEKIALTQKFDRGLEVTLEKDAPKTEATCHSPEIVVFSRVGFDRTRTFAIVVVTEITGKGPYPGCGYITWSTGVFRRSGREWKYYGGGGISIT